MIDGVQMQQSGLFFILVGDLIMPHRLTRHLIPALLLAAFPMHAEQAPHSSPSTVVTLVFYKTMGGDGDSPSGGDGPCYDQAVTVRDACLKAAEEAKSGGMASICRATYAAQIAACDTAMGE